MAVLPDSRGIGSEPGVDVGVIGGIPTDRSNIINVTLTPYFADNTGATDAKAAIQSAISAAASGDIVYLPAGTYRLDSSLTVGPSDSNITIRGDGATTILDLGSGAGLFIGSQPNTSDWAWAGQQYAEPSTNNTVTAGLTKGSTVLTIADTSPFSVGDLIQVAVTNQEDNTEITGGAIVSVHVLGIETMRRQMMRVQSKTGTTLTVFPGVHWTPESNLVAKVNRQSTITQGVGIEDLRIDATDNNEVQVFLFAACFNCWANGVIVTSPTNYGITFVTSLNCELRDCDILDAKTQGSTNHAGLLLNQCVNGLIVNNIIYNNWPQVEANESSQGNVGFGNFFYSTFAGCSIIEHGSHPSFNLWEANILLGFQQDGYFSSASNNEIFRNWVTGMNFAEDTVVPMIALARFTRNYELKGNVFGAPGWAGDLYDSPYNLGAAYGFSGTSVGATQPSAGTFWSDWGMTCTLTTRTSDTTGTITVSQLGTLENGATVYIKWPGSANTTLGTVGVPTGLVFPVTMSSGVLPSTTTVGDVYTGPAGYEERDRDVFLTSDPDFPGSTTALGNFFAWAAGGNAIPASESLGTDTIPNSYTYTSGAPAWWGGKTWPAFGLAAGDVSQNGFNRIPAGERFLQNYNGALPGTLTVSGATNVSGTLTLP